MKQLIKLQNGNLMPIRGLGTAETILDDEKMYVLFKKAFEIGYRHFDTAPLHKNQRSIGKALNKLFKEDGYDRKEFFITAKILPYKQHNTIFELEYILQKLQLDYVDLFLVHSPIVPINKDQPQVMTGKPHHIIWKEMEKSVEEGLTKSIGLSNFNVQSLYNLLSFCNIRPQVNQVEISPYCMQFDLQKFCREQDIAITGYANLARGGVGVKHRVGKKIDIFNEEILLELSKKYQKPINQIVLNYICSQNIAVIPKTENVERLAANFEFIDFTLEEKDIQKLRELDHFIRTVDTSMVRNWNYLNVFA